MTLPSFLFESIDFSYMTVCVIEKPFVGLLRLQKIDQGMLLHSISVNPSKSNKGIVSKIFRDDCQLAIMNKQGGRS